MAVTSTPANSAIDICARALILIGAEPITSFEILCLRIMTKNDDALDGIKSIINSEHPWRREKIFDDIMASYSRNKGKLSEFEENWFSGNRILALGKLIRTIMN